MWVIGWTAEIDSEICTNDEGGLLFHLMQSLDYETLTDNQDG